MNGTSRERTSSTAHAAPAGARRRAGIVHAKLAHQRIERHHLGGVIGQHLHRLFRGQDVELAGIEDEVALLAEMHRFPEIGDVAPGAALDVDQPL